VAEEVAAELGVSIGAVQGYALVLIVEGTWWELASPGFALCSLEAAQDPETANAVLRQVFISGAVG
jgi:hypothetical protein